MKLASRIAIMVASVLISAVFGVVLKRVYKNGVPRFTVMTVLMFALFLVSLVCAALFEGFLLLGWAKRPLDVGPLVLAGLLNAGAFFLAIKAYDSMLLW